MGHARQKPKHLARKLLAIRESLCLSQPQMAQRLNLHGYYHRISEFEHGRRQPDLIVLLAYARAARIPLEHIVDDDINVELN